MYIIILSLVGSSLRLIIRVHSNRATKIVKLNIDFTTILKWKH